MSKNNFKIKTLFLLIFLFIFNTPGYSEKMILSGCKNLKDGFIKNEYVLDFEKSLVTRNYIYDNKTFKKYRINDLSVKKKIQLNNFSIKKKI